MKYIQVIAKVLYWIVISVFIAAMAAGAMLAVLMIVGGLFGLGYRTAQSRCPDLIATSTAIYRITEDYSIQTTGGGVTRVPITGKEFEEGQHILLKAPGTTTLVQWKSDSKGTTTIENITATIKYEEVGRKVVPGAEEYNKRVEECRTLNGEFNYGDE